MLLLITDLASLLRIGDLSSALLITNLSNGKSISCVNHILIDTVSCRFIAIVDNSNCRVLHSCCQSCLNFFFSIRFLCLAVGHCRLRLTRRGKCYDSLAGGTEGTDGTGNRRMNE